MVDGVPAPGTTGKMGGRSIPGREPQLEPQAKEAEKAQQKQQ